MKPMTIGHALRLNKGDKVKRLDVSREKCIVNGKPKLNGKSVKVPVVSPSQGDCEIWHIELENTK